MKQKLCSLVLFFSFLAISFSGCGGARETATPQSSGSGAAAVLKVGMVTDKGGLGDQSFNDSAHRGLEKAKADLHVEIKVLESHSAADYEPNLQALAQAGYNVIFAVGYLMTDAVKDVAPQYPDTKFAIIDGRIDGIPNVTSLTFKEQEGSFLAGLLAGLMTRTKTVGFIGGEQSWLIEKFEAGYKAGVETANPKVRVLTGYTGSFVDPAKGKELALAQFGQGADIIFHAAGACGTGVIEAAKEKGKGFYAIGVDSDQDYLGTADPEHPAPPGRVLTSMVKHVDVAVFKTIQALTQGKFQSGIQSFGLKEDGVGLSDMKYTRQAIPPAVLKKIDDYRKKIAAGKIAVPDTLAKLKDFSSAAL